VLEEFLKKQIQELVELISFGGFKMERQKYTVLLTILLLKRIRFFGAGEV
jgi:hypothetical protein